MLVLEVIHLAPQSIVFSINMKYDELIAFFNLFL